METKEFRKAKIEFITDDNIILKSDYFENLLKDKNLSTDEKWFIRGCLHITQRHYTEAIKRFQLSKTDDAKLLILACTFKIADKFLFNEYYTKKLGNYIYFEKYKFYPYFSYNLERTKIDINFIEKIKENF